MRRALLAVLAATATLVAVPAGTAEATAPADPAAGALFFLRSVHYCSGSVVHSSGHDLVLTAAHCVLDGTGLGIGFAPGYHDGVAPDGIWTVTRVYVDDAWRLHRDPRHDVAILRVAPKDGRNVEDVAGAHVLGTAPAAGIDVTATGYIAGRGGSPVTCSAPVYYTDGFPSFDCAGFAGGVSGGPWIADGRLVGETGGLHQGGCSSSTSYSPAFGPAVAALLARAETGGRGDLVPPAGPSGC